MTTINEPIIHVSTAVNIEFVCCPIFVLLLVNLRSGTKAKGSSNDSIIDAMIINWPAAEEPPIIDTIKLGRIAKDLVTRLRIQGFIRRSKNP